jgi:general secretion pathway protein D
VKHLRRRGWLRAGTLAAIAVTWPAAINAQQAPPQPDAATTPAPASGQIIQQTTPPRAAQRKPVPLKNMREAERAYISGAKALDQRDPRLALQYFDHALELDPENTRYLSAREIAREHVVTLLVQEAEQAKISGNLDRVLDKLSEARAMDPSNPIVAQHRMELDAILSRGSLASSVEEGVQLNPPVELAPNPGRRDFHLRTGTVDLIRRVINAYGITVIVDDSVKKDNLRLDVDNLDFNQATDLLALMTDSFFVPLDPRRVLVARNSKDNRQKFERVAIETISMPGLTTTEMTDMSSIAKTIFDIPAEIVQGDTGTMRLRGPADRLKALNATFSELLEGRAQVELEVKVITLDRTRTKEVGVQLPQQTTVFSVSTEVDNLIANNQSLVNQIISSGLAQAGDTTAIAAILIASGAAGSSLLSQPFALFGGGLTALGLSLGSVSGSLSLNSADSRSLDDVNMRVVDQEAATFRSGSRYPIITSTYNSGVSSSGINIPGLSTAGVSSTLASLGISPSSILASQQTIPQVQYEDLGLTLKVTPHVQQGKAVALNVDLQVESLGGSFLNAIPVLNHQQYTGFITLKDGESAVVVSYLDHSQTRAVSGLPGMIELPGLHSTTSRNTTETESDLLVLITPHVLRLSSTMPHGQLVSLPYHD